MVTISPIQGAQDHTSGQSGRGLSLTPEQTKSQMMDGHGPAMSTDFPHFLTDGLGRVMTKTHRHETIAVNAHILKAPCTGRDSRGLSSTCWSSDRQVLRRAQNRGPLFIIKTAQVGGLVRIHADIHHVNLPGDAARCPLFVCTINPLRHTSVGRLRPCSYDDSGSTPYPGHAGHHQPSDPASPVGPES